MTSATWDLLQLGMVLAGCYLVGAALGRLFALGMHHGCKARQRREPPEDGSC